MLRTVAATRPRPLLPSNLTAVRCFSVSSRQCAIGHSRDSGSRSRLSSQSSPRVTARPPPGKPASSPGKTKIETSSAPTNLVAPVNVAEDPHGVLKSGHPASKILENSAVMIQRQVELGNLLLGFEQANKYVIMDPNGNHIGFMAEERKGIMNEIGRQLFRTHRAFTAHVFDTEEREVLTINRPFSYINSRVKIFDPLQPHSFEHQPSPHDYRVIGEVQQRWNLVKRKYDLFLHHNPTTSTLSSGDSFAQFAYINEPMLSWDFALRGAQDNVIGAVNKNFVGLARELFTDTSVYALKMDAAVLENLASDEELNDLSAALEREANAFAEELKNSGEANIKAFQQGRFKDMHPPALGFRAFELNGLAQTIAQEKEKVAAAKSGMGGETAMDRGMTLDERAVMLATAVTIDFDYFSRHSDRGSGWGMAALWAMIFSGD